MFRRSYSDRRRVGYGEIAIANFEGNKDGADRSQAKGLLTLQLLVPSSSAAERAKTADELLEVDRPAAAVENVSTGARLTTTRRGHESGQACSDVARRVRPTGREFG